MAILLGGLAAAFLGVNAHFTSKSVNTDWPQQGLPWASFFFFFVVLLRGSGNSKWR
jgi:hypothetical protein